MSATATSAAYIRGLSRGYRLAGRSLFRRFLVQLLVAAVLWGGGVGFLWAAAEVFFRNTSSEKSVKKLVLTKYQTWNRLHR